MAFNPGYSNWKLMDVGPQRIGCKALFPKARREFDYTTCGMFADPLQDIDEVGVRIDAMQAASHDQALDDADVFGAELSPTEEP